MARGWGCGGGYGSNKYYVTSQANYETAVQSLIFPQGFSDYEGKNNV